MNPLEGQIKERQQGLKRRLDSIRRIHQAVDSLGDRIDEIDEAERAMTAQVMELENLRLEINAMLVQDMLDPDAESTGFDVSL